MSGQPWDLGGPRSYTHLELAQAVYGVDAPTAAQLSAIRRAVAVLTARGQAHRTRAKVTRTRRLLTEPEQEQRDELIRATRARRGLTP